MIFRLNSARKLLMIVSIENEIILKIVFLFYNILFISMSSLNFVEKTENKQGHLINLI